MSKKKIEAVEKPWGREETWADTPYYRGKFLTIDAGHRLSRKYHRSRIHTVAVVSGVLTIEVGPRFHGDQIIPVDVKEGESYDLPSGQIHRFCAETGTVRLVEVSQGGVTDYIRVEDDYDRITNLPEILKHSDK